MVREPNSNTYPSSCLDVHRIILKDDMRNQSPASRPQVYLGAPNVASFAPSPNSYIDIRDFETLEQLADRLAYLDGNDTAYDEMHAWREKSLGEEFRRQASLGFMQWVFYGERWGMSA